MNLSEGKKETIVRELEDEGAERIELFGSFAREDADSESDVDLLVSFSGSKTLLEVARIERELSELIGIDVDIVTEQSLSPHIADRIKHREVLQA